MIARYVLETLGLQVKSWQPIRNRWPSLLGVTSWFSTSQPRLSLAWDWAIISTNSSYAGLKKEAGSLESSTAITSNFSELDRANQMLNAGSEETTEQASESCLRASELEDEAWEKDIPISNSSTNFTCATMIEVVMHFHQLPQYEMITVRTARSLGSWSSMFSF